MKSKELLDSFVAYCVANPDQRFWQALRNWSGFAFVFVANTHLPVDLRDTFYWEGKRSN